MGYAGATAIGCATAFGGGPLNASNGTGTAKYGGYGILMDPQSPTYRFLAANGKNRDTKLRRDIQANDADSWQDEYLSEIGMEYRMERWSRLMTGVTG